MDAEPVSCRRTDGRKWRCRLPVLPDQKYCERHVNRGRFRSRKPVEEVQTTLLNSKSKSTGTKSIPLLQSHAKIKHNKASIKNQSLKIKKHSMEDTFSAKSVVQDGNDVDGGVSSNGHESTQSERCRRTDGRKWQCKKDVLPGMKYCVQHMHRGVKKVAKPNPCLSFIVGVNGNQPNDSRSSSETTTISM